MSSKECRLRFLVSQIIIIIIILITIILIKNECHGNIVVDKLQGCSHSKKLREGEVTQQ